MCLQYVTWAELLYIQLLTPNASFLGHLAGILAGMLHITVLQRLPMLRSGPRPFSGTGHYTQDSDPSRVSLGVLTVSMTFLQSAHAA